MKYALAACAVLLGMGMSPADSKLDPWQRPDLIKIREVARDCHDRVGSDALGRVDCLITQNRNLDRALGRYLAEVRNQMPPSQNSLLQSVQGAWETYRDHSPTTARLSVEDKITALTQRYFETLRRIQWLAERASSIRKPAHVRPAAGPYQRADLIKAQLQFTGCNLNQRTRLTSGKCTGQMKQSLTTALDAFLAEQLNKISGVRRRQIEETEVRW